MNRNRVLGKGLSALIQGADLRGVPRSEAEAPGITRIPLGKIGFNPDQPRKLFDDSKLEELADSLRQVGILQPVLVREVDGGQGVKPHPDSNARPEDLKYCVVAGERRVRAARLAGLSDVPALICTYEETEALKVALLENIQREDLGPVEEAEAYRGLMDSYGATQEELAEMLGKKRSSVANMLRILTLEKEILTQLESGKISRGHAKALLGMPPGPGRLQLAKLCESRGLSVRECERRVQAGGARPSRRTRKGKTGADPDDPGVRALVERAEQVFGSPVAIERGGKDGKGSVTVRFYSDSDLIRVLKIMGVDTDIS
jgi:ParB family chromosome partitioning protein